MNTFLIITLFILFFSILQGWRKGILGLIVGFVSWIFVFLFVAFAHPYVETFLRDNTHIYDKVYEKTGEYIQKKVDSVEQNTGIAEWWDAVTRDIPKIAIKDLRAKVAFQIPENVADGAATDEMMEKFKEDLVLQISDFALQGIAVLMSFVIAEIFVAIARGLVESMGKLPVIREVNNFLGIIAGAVEGFIVIWILMYMTACACGTTIGQMFLANINASAFLTYLYQHNLIFAIISTL